jgi:membrane protease YdiL (CAAX protease family)
MEPAPFATRAGAFVRSVMPAEPAHWLLLLGAMCLFICQHLRWWPEQHWTPSWVSLATVLAFAFVLASAGAYYAALVPSTRSGRLLTISILTALATFATIAGIAAFFFSDVLGLSNRPSLIIDGGSDYGSAILHVIPRLGLGAGFALAGIFLMLVFLRLFKTDRANLPIRLGRNQTDDLSLDDIRIRGFAWKMICLAPLAMISSGPLIFLVVAIWPHVSRNPNLSLLTESVASAAGIFLLVAFALGKDREETFAAAVKVPAAKYIGFAVFVPAVLACIWPAALFLYDRILWAERDLGRYMQPGIENRFAMPAAMTLILILPAFVEEIAWRGFLQPPMIRNFGLARGIFLVGVVWGAFHFFVDYNAHMTLTIVLLTLLRRFSETIALSYVLGWLTLRSKSIIPAALAHGVFNIFIFSQPATHLQIWVLIAFWAAAGYLLFRLFPPAITQESREENIPAPPPEAVQPDYS